MDTIGERIRAARLARGMSQEELASKVGYSGRSSINKIEMGKSFPNQKYVTALASALGVSASWLLGIEDNDKTGVLERAFNERPEMRMLFSVAEDCTTEEIEQAIKIIEALKK